MKKHKYPYALALTLVSTASLLPSFEAAACTRLFWNDPNQIQMVARSLDYFQPMTTKLRVTPVGNPDNGGNISNPAMWVSKYGSVVVVGTLDVAIAGDGVNTKGLAYHGLLHEKAKYEVRDGRPGVQLSKFGQFLLDNASTVSEAIGLAKKFQLVPDSSFLLHIALEDTSGDSAIIEWVNGKMNVYHHYDYNVLTNDPAFPDQLANLKKYRYFYWGGTLPLPGEVDSSSRFVRGSAFLNTLPVPIRQNQAVSYMFSAIRGVSSPFGALEFDDTNHPGEPPQTCWPTVFTLVYDLYNKRIYFNQIDAGNDFWVNMKRLNFTKGAAKVCLNTKWPNLYGEVSSRFTSTACLK
jgi:choloylglycine hydrolase